MQDLNDTSGDIEVRHSSIHGHGAFAARDIPAGTTLGRYAGRRYTAKQVARKNWDAPETYVFGLSDGSIIDGAQGGNATRYLNHSCAPNCQAVETESDAGRLDIEIEALAAIPKGAELLLDYQLVLDASDDSPYVCRCGVAACRGTMAADAA